MLLVRIGWRFTGKKKPRKRAGRNERVVDKEIRYTEKQFCAMFQIDRKTALRWRKVGIIRHIKTPTGMIRYRQSDIDEFERKNMKGKK